MERRKEGRNERRKGRMKEGRNEKMNERLRNDRDYIYIA